MAAAAGAAAVRGAEVRRHRLSELSYRGCIGCGACRAEGGGRGCSLEDDLTPVLADTAGAAALIVGAPIYYGYPSGLFKSYLDRWYSFRGPDRRLRGQEGRPCLLILTQGHPSPDAYEWTLGSLKKVLTSYGFVPTLLVGADLEGAGAAAARPELLAEAERLGAGLAGA